MIFYIAFRVDPLITKKAYDSKRRHEVVTILTTTILPEQFSSTRAGGQFHQCFTGCFYMHRSQKAQKDIDNLTEFLQFWDLGV